MASMETDLFRDQLKGMEAKILERLRSVVPVGFAHNTTEGARNYRALYRCDIDDNIPADQAADILGESLDAAVTDQLGTLGGGNHFLEFQTDPANHVRVMIHSGSRNIGKMVCDQFTQVADTLNKRWHSKSSIPFLPFDSEEGQDYIAWMRYCLWFSTANKQFMLNSVRRVLSEEFGATFQEPPIIVHHNYAALENHMGHNWWVHRKGATSAKKEQVGIIPGSMGTPSYITRGLGNVLSLNSCSHGAGRRMGRMDRSEEHTSELQSHAC
jgi:tRNA-splicing ligase RtcB